LNVKTILRTRKWRLWLKLFNTLFKIHVLGKTPLRFADIAVSYDCNLNCVHCSASKLKKKGAKKLSLSEYKKVAED